MEERLGILPYHDQGCKRASTVVRFTPLVLASEMAGGSRLHFFTVNKLYWIIVTFSRAVTYSQNEMSIQPLHARRLLYFLHTWPTWLHTALS